MNLSELGVADLLRVCRDLAWSEIAAMPATSKKLGLKRLNAAVIDWSANGAALDSLACMQLATAAATWCDAFETGYEDLFLAKRNAADWAIAMGRVAQRGGKQLTFSTSGSTGARKHIRHQLANLMDEARLWAGLLGCDQNRGAPDNAVKRVVALAPTHHIYGFIWGILVPKALGVPVIDAELDHMPELLPGDLVVAVPDQWAWLANSQHLTASWPGGVRGISSTAALPTEVHQQLTSRSSSVPVGLPEKAPLAQLVHIYGSAETAGLAWRDSPHAAYCLADSRIRTAADGIALLRQGEPPAELAVQDELQWVDQRRFHVVARLDQCVQVAGHNVSPAWVSSQLASHSGVEQVCVRLCTSAQPPRLKAFIVLKPVDRLDLRADIETWAAENLPWYACPCAFTYGLALPRSSVGKLCDWPHQTTTL